MESSLGLGPSGPANISITTPFINVRFTLEAISWRQIKASLDLDFKLVGTATRIESFESIAYLYRKRKPLRANRINPVTLRGASALAARKGTVQGGRLGVSYAAGRKKGGPCVVRALSLGATGRYGTEGYCGVRGRTLGCEVAVQGVSGQRIPEFMFIMLDMRMSNKGFPF